MLFSTADLYDESLNGGRPLEVCELQLKSYGGRRGFHGPIATVRCLPDDNSLVRPTLEQNGAGRVLVIDAGGSLRTAQVGDILGRLALERGWAGIVVHGAVRDTVGLAQLNLGVKALGTIPRKSAKSGRGEIEVEVQFGGVSFRPGHWLYADEDGLLVSPIEWPARV